MKVTLDFDSGVISCIEWDDEGFIFNQKEAEITDEIDAALDHLFVLMGYDPKAEE